ncbi:MAG: endonuclease III [Rhabdochlamydiaceae bacterium]|nr:endonuclease III [Rhabdochlamydiaceae bacterium]
MHKKDRAALIDQILNTFFPTPSIPLQHTDPYTLLIAVLLSAQCTDERVNQVTPHLFAKASTPQQMIQLTAGDIEKIIKPCGLGPTKAKAIWNLSKQLIEKHKGKVPNTFEELEALPGVGHKTASVVMSQAFHKPAFPVDTHIHRCAKRWKLSSGKNVVETEKDLKKLFPKEHWNRLHLQIIYFARTYCPARGHHPETCPICCVIK